MGDMAGVNSVACVVYDSPADRPGILSDVVDNREKYEERARKGREAVLREHKRGMVSKMLFG